MRLINADEFRKRIDHYPPDIRNIAKKELRYVKTIDAVQVVRCNDCINWFQEREDELGWCGMNDDYTPPRWFCADGESRIEVEE